MTATCEIRTQGINQTMTRATGAYDAIHRGMFETEELLSFFKNFAFIPERAVQNPPVSVLPLHMREVLKDSLPSRLAKVFSSGRTRIA